MIANLKLLQQVRPFVRSTVFGSGPERCLYDLNPDLPCQSPRLLPLHITSLHDMLLALDRYAVSHGATEDVLTRHDAAYIASKLELRTDPKVPMLLGHPALASDPHLISLYLIISAARKADLRVLPGLAHWLAVRIAPLFEKIHNRTFRESLRDSFVRTSKEGNLGALAKMVFDPTLLSKDERQFRDVERWYEGLQKQISFSRSTELHRFRALQLSRWFAQAVSSCTCAAVVYGTLKYYLHW